MQNFERVLILLKFLIFDDNPDIDVVVGERF
jgi:hypothetical protein